MNTFSHWLSFEEMTAKGIEVPLGKWYVHKNNDGKYHCGSPYPFDSFDSVLMYAETIAQAALIPVDVGATIVKIEISVKEAK